MLTRIINNGVLICAVHVNRLTFTRRQRWLRQLPLPFLLLVADSSGFRLQITNFTEVKPYSSCSKRVGLRLAAIFLVGSAETADEGVQAAPGLAEGARAGGGWVGVAVEGADWGVNLGFPELVEVAEEFKHVGATATGERERGTVVLQVLPEGVPVPAFLVLVATESGGAAG